MQLNVIICGVGGQGNLLASAAISTYAMTEDFNVVGTETIGAAQRGGSVISHIRISDKEIYSPLVPVGRADIFIALEPLEALRQIRLLSKEGTYLINSEPVPTVSVNMGMDTYPALDDIIGAISGLCKKGNVVNATHKARELGNPTLTNVIMLGALSASSAFFDPQKFEGILAEVVPSKFLSQNIEAFREGVCLLESRDGGI